jgi:hypothetical protein
MAAYVTKNVLVDKLPSFLFEKFSDLTKYRQIEIKHTLLFA